MKIKTILPLALIGLMLACGSATKLERSWADPSFTASMKPFTKILVIAPLKDANSQRIAEDKLVSELKAGVAGVQSYTYLQPADTVQALLESKLLKDGFDGIILMRLKDVEKSTSYTPGTSYGGYYGGYGGYRGYGYGGYGYGGGYYGSGYSEGHYNEDKTYMVETNFYSISDRKLLWAGTTSTLNPTKFDKTLDQIIYAIKYELQKKGLIKK